MTKVFEPFPGAFDHILGPDGDYPDIPDTPEQRALIREHNERMRREHPDLVQIDPPVESGGPVMASLETYKRRLEDWRREAKTNQHGMAKYAERAIRLLSDQIKPKEGQSDG